MQATAEARTASTDADVEQLAHGIAHDLAQPLTTISGFARLLISRYDIELDDEAREHLEAITKQAADMQDMIDGIVETLRSSVSGQADTRHAADPRHAIAA